MRDIDFIDPNNINTKSDHFQEFLHKRFVCNASEFGEWLSERLERDEWRPYLYVSIGACANLNWIPTTEYNPKSKNINKITEFLKINFKNINYYIHSEECILFEKKEDRLLFVLKYQEDCDD